MRSYGHPPESLYKEPGGATLHLLPPDSSLDVYPCLGLFSLSRLILNLVLLLFADYTISSECCSFCELCCCKIKAYKNSSCVFNFCQIRNKLVTSDDRAHDGQPHRSGCRQGRATGTFQQSQTVFNTSTWTLSDHCHHPTDIRTS